MRLRYFFGAMAACFANFLLLSNVSAYNAPTGIDIRVGTDTEYTYYIRAEYDGIDANKNASSNTNLLDLIEYKTFVEDEFPEGLDFVGFSTSEDGSFGGIRRDNSGASCGGTVIDDTKESRVNEGTWNADHSEYYYHGLHYNSSTRKISYTIEGLQAGCRLDIGVKYKTPATIDDPNTPEIEIRRDFYNKPTFHTSTGTTRNGSIAHIYLLQDYTSNSQIPIMYRYKNAPTDVVLQDLPAQKKVPKGATVKIEPNQHYSNYHFEWKINHATIQPDENGYFTIPTNFSSAQLIINGIFTPFEEGETDDTPTYTVHYEIENAPAWYQAPRDKDYLEGENVSVDRSMKRIRSSLYEFSGWESDDIELNDTDVFSMPSQDVTIRGNFSNKSFQVSYAFEGDLPPNADELLPEAQNYFPGDEIVTPENPSADGYVFSGWYLDDGFRMPNEDITITGRWRQVDGVFEPELSIKLTDSSDQFKKSETANFEITVTNTTDFALKSVLLRELLEGATFIDGDNYEAQDNLALISQIPANGSITLRASYPIKNSDPNTITNTVDIVSATSDGNYTLAAKDYKKSVDFYLYEEATNANTGDAIVFFVVVILGASIIAVTIFQFNTRRRTNKNTRKVIAITALILSGSAIAIHICSAMSIFSTNGHSIAGVYDVTAQAQWIDYATARIDIRLESTLQDSQKPRDVIYLVNNSRGMTDIMDITKEKLSENASELLSNSNNRAALISFNTEATIQTELSSDTAAISAAIDNLDTTGHTDYATALNKVREYLASYDHSENRDLIIVLIANVMPDYGEDAGPLAYYFLKRDYPFADIAAVQYQMWPGKVLSPYSDRQYFASTEERITTDFMDDINEYGLAIKRAQTPVKGFDNLYIDHVIDSENFDIQSVLSSYGTISTDNNHVIWNASGAEAGSSIKAQIIVKLKDEAIAAEADNYHLLSPLHVNYQINDLDGEEDICDNLSLSGFNTVDYELNPAEATIVSGEIPEQTKYLAYSAVPISDSVLYYRNYSTNFYHDFIGWTPASTDLIYSGRDYFVMDDSPVTLRPVWGHITLSTVSDGQAYKATSAQINTSQSGFNYKIMRLTGTPENGPQYVTKYTNTTLKGFRRADELPADFVANSDNTITGFSSTHPVYVWVEDDIAYYYTAGVGKDVVTSLSHTFEGFTALEDISGVANWDTSQVTSLYQTFDYDRSLEDFSPIANWDTRNVTSLSNTFASTKIATLEPMRNWNLGKLTSLTTAFQSTRYLKDISVLENLDTSNVTSMSYIFSYSAFTSTAPLANWDVSKVKDFSSVFGSNKSLRDLSGLENWDVSNATNMSGMFFDDCQMDSLEPLRSWNVSNVTDMNYMFYCNPGNAPQNLTTLEPIFGWNVNSTANKSSMFNNINLPLPAWY